MKGLRNPLDHLAPGRPLTLAGVADGAQGLFTDDTDLGSVKQGKARLLVALACFVLSAYYRKIIVREARRTLPDDTQNVWTKAMSRPEMLTDEALRARCAYRWCIAVFLSMALIVGVIGAIVA